MPSRASASCDLLARLVDPPLDGGERDLERVGDLRVGEPDDVAQQERHLQVEVELVDRAPDGVDRLAAARPARRGPRAGRCRRASTSGRGRRSLARSSSSTRFFVTWNSQVVNLQRSEKRGRPWKTRRKTSCVRSSASDAVADEPQDVVEDRRLVGADDEREGALVTPLGLAQDRRDQAAGATRRAGV